ncbi:hypothetical protein BDQ12DRAFT_87741 [Crucibulum laeve]|uniref:DUF6534 domain-containing protein n=1 Tax=Crucibulum laeve TaxID=68775 RepID=A0A5C3M0X0_9AGAR|nr:hypothetical protein BDQ12DRAFT_87741 [Crucibulum laeve]
MDATTPTVLPAIHDTFGAVFIGVLVAGALWGVTCMQTYEYFEHNTSDRWILKSLVTIVFVSDTFHQALMSHTIYTYLVTNYFDPTYLIKVVWSLVAELLASGVVSLIAQGFFAWRVWILSRGRKGMAVVTLLVCLVLGNFTVTIVYFVRALNTSTFIELRNLSTLSRALNTIGVVADVAITMAMIWLLHSMKTGFHRSNQIISRLILFSLSTGLLTTLCALMCLISISVWPNTLIFIGFYACLSRRKYLYLFSAY